MTEQKMGWVKYTASRPPRVGDVVKVGDVVTSVVNVAEARAVAHMLTRWTGCPTCSNSEPHDVTACERSVWTQPIVSVDIATRPVSAPYQVAHSVADVVAVFGFGSPEHLWVQAHPESLPLALAAQPPSQPAKGPQGATSAEREGVSVGGAATPAGLIRIPPRTLPGVEVVPHGGGPGGGPAIAAALRAPPKPDTATLARALFNHRMRPEATRIAEPSQVEIPTGQTLRFGGRPVVELKPAYRDNAAAVAHVLDVMWERTKPDERKACEAEAAAIVGVWP